MQKILFILLAISYTLFANALPNSISTTISTVSSNGNIQLSGNIPKGMSGIVIHNYGNGLSAITHATISQGNSHASLIPYEAISHDNIPNIQTEAKAGDRVIFGNFYNNALVIAPNRDIYRKITTTYKKTWIHPDTYAVEFMKNGETHLTLKSLKKFAQLNQIGLVLIIAQNRLLILDPISEQFIGSVPMQVNQANAMAPFYARFGQMDTSVFGFSEKNYTPYFKSVAGVK